MWANLRENQTSWPASSVVVGRGFPEQASRQAGGRLAADVGDDVPGYGWSCSAGCQNRQPLMAWPVMALAAALSEV